MPFMRVLQQPRQVFENKQIGTGFQNVAAIQDYNFEIPSNTKQTVTIEVLCINQKQKPPFGSLNLTNLQVAGNFTDQQSLWNLMDISKTI